MKVYRLVHKYYKGEVVFGIPPSYCNGEEEPINKLFNNMKPWKHCIPYYKNSKFTFVSSDALITFFKWNTNLTEEEYNKIYDNYYVESFELSTWSTGLSKFLCTYFDDEVIPDTLETYDIKDFLNRNYDVVCQDYVPQENIRWCKESYYKNIKTYY